MGHANTETRSEAALGILPRARLAPASPPARREQPAEVGIGMDFACPKVFPGRYSVRSRCLVRVNTATEQAATGSHERFYDRKPGIVQVHQHCRVEGSLRCALPRG